MWLKLIYYLLTDSIIFCPYTCKNVNRHFVDLKRVMCSVTCFMSAVSLRLQPHSDKESL